MATHKNEASAEAHSEEQEQDNTEYPSTRKVIPVMAAVWLAFFVVALVRIIRPSEVIGLTFLGSHNHRHGSTDNF